MKIGAIYIRVSTDDQTEYSPDAQKRALLEYAKKNDIAISNNHIFVDEGISGRKAEKRPAFMCMIGMAKTQPRPFDVILVHKFDRFARSREDSIVYKSMLRKECGIAVVSITEHIEDDKFAVIMEAMLEAMAEYYSINLAEEVKKGMTEKALRGEYQAYAPFGYRMENGKLVIDELQADTVRSIFDNYLHHNMSFFAIARKLNDSGIKTIRGNLWENRTVKYVLQNPVYKGYVRWNPEGKHDLRQHKYAGDNFIIAKGSHVPIVSEEVFDAVAEKIESGYRSCRKRPPETLANWLGGVLRCSNCGGTLSSGGRGGFQCTNYSKGKCNVSHYISFARANAAVLDALKECIDTKEFAYDVPPQKDKLTEISELKTQLKRLNAREARAKEAFLAGIDTIEEYREFRSLCQKEQAQLEARIEELVNDRPTENREEMCRRISSVYDLLCSDAGTSDKNVAIKSITDHITYDKRTDRMDFYLILH